MAKRQPKPITQAQQSKPGTSQARAAKAYGVLADQPVSVAGLTAAQRNEVIISAVLSEDNSTHILSRYADDVWAMWPYVTTPNTANRSKRLDWTCIPESYREACKAVVYGYWKVGRRGWKAPGITSLVATQINLRAICRYFASLGIASLRDVQPLHVANFIHVQRSAGYSKSHLSSRFATLELLYIFRDQHPDTLQAHPWPDSSACDMAGFVGQGEKDARNTGKTPLIPPDVAQALFLHAERILNGADAILDERDTGQRSAYMDPEVTGIRDACFYLLGVLTGPRNSEMSSIETCAGRAEVKNGITFHWLAATEYKTGKGRVEYLMPEMGHRILRVLERWSEPYRGKLAEQIIAWENESGTPTGERLNALNAARVSRNRLFLSNGKNGITVVTGAAWGNICKRFAQQAGVDWDIAPHQMRRLYAYTFVRHRLGDLLFLKEQFKHSSIDMSQLYASNPHQDAAIYDEILEEQNIYKAGVVAHWLEADEPLAGGAGRKIMAMRAHDFPDRTALIEETSSRISIRSTGHSWCLAQDEGCGGSGIYERGRCGDCHNGLIDSRFAPIWQEAYQHHQELLRDAQELGPGAVKRVEDDLKQAAAILKDLGVPVDKGVEDDKLVAS